MTWRGKVRDFFQPSVVSYLEKQKDIKGDYEGSSIESLPVEEFRQEYPRGNYKSWGKFEFLRVFDWYPSHYCKDEKWLLFKIDLFVLGYGVLNFYSKYLDQNNITNAFVSGMSDDLHLYGNELNNMITMYDIGYCIGEIPVLIFMTRKNSWYVLPFAELLWGICTVCSAKATNINQMYALRFLVGLFESPTFPGIHYCLGSWYQTAELHKRAGVFYLSSAAGSMSSGYLQTAAYKNLSGKSGLSGWRWMFIIDAIITIPTAIYGFLFFPGIPKFDRPKGPFNKKQLEFVRVRMYESGVEDPKELKWSMFKRIFGKWQIWAFSLLWCLFNSAIYNSAFSLFLKADGGYSIPQINNYPTISHAYGALSAIVSAAAVDIYPREKVVPPLFVLIFFAYICLLVWEIPKGLKFAAYILTSSSSANSPIFLSWVTDLMKDDAEGRAITLALINSLSFAFAAFLPNILYNGKYSPEFKLGFGTSLGFYVYMFVIFWIVCFIHRREERILAKLISEEHTASESDVSVIKIKESTKGKRLYDQAL